MAKAGQTKSTTTKDKDFAGSGVEGQKGQDAEQVTPPVDPKSGVPSVQTVAEPYEKASPAPPAKKSPAFDTTGATYTITHRHGGPKKVWFRDGKEIGVEDAG